MVFWHPKGWVHLAAGRAVHAPRLPGQRLSGSALPADPRPLAVGEERPLGELQGQHVHDGVGETRLRDQADELPGTRAGVQLGTCAATATCRCATANSAPAIATNPRGALHGIMRVRGFTQDDGHIFCTEDQILPECAAFTALLQKVYADFGFTEIIYKVATRPDKRVGADALWDKAEQALDRVASRSGVRVRDFAGRGRLLRTQDRVSLKDAIGRVVAMRHDAGGLHDAGAPRRGVRRRGQLAQARPSCCTAPSWARWSASSASSSRTTPGAMPPWLAPVQVVVMNVTDRQEAYVREVVDGLARGRHPGRGRFAERENNV